MELKATTTVTKPLDGVYEFWSTLDAPTLRTGQCHVQRYMRLLLERIERGELDPTRIITHRLPLAEAPRGYDMFTNKEEGCEKVVLTP